MVELENANSGNRQLIKVGSISSVHGLKGSIVIHSDSDKDSALAYLAQVWVGKTEDTAVCYNVVEADWMPRGWKVTLEGVTTIEAGELLKGQTAWAERDWLEETEDNEFYVSDLVGCTVKEEGSEQVLGILTHIEFTQTKEGHDRWWVKGPSGEFSIPAHAKFIRRVDAEAREVWISDLQELKP